MAATAATGSSGIGGLYSVDPTSMANWNTATTALGAPYVTGSTGTMNANYYQPITAVAPTDTSLSGTVGWNGGTSPTTTPTTTAWASWYLKVLNIKT